jgi:hypothetical protein
MAEKKDKGSATAQRANARAAKERETNPRKSSAAQAELGKKGGKAAATDRADQIPPRRKRQRRLFSPRAQRTRRKALVPFVLFVRTPFFLS